MNRKILIVDDDENILILYSRALQKHNYETATLTSTEYLLDIVKEDKPDLIIMDIWIPVIGGEAAAELLNFKLDENVHIKTNKYGFLGAVNLWKFEAGITR